MTSPGAKATEYMLRALRSELDLAGRTEPQGFMFTQLPPAVVGALVKAGLAKRFIFQGRSTYILTAVGNTWFKARSAETKPVSSPQRAGLVQTIGSTGAAEKVSRDVRRKGKRMGKQSASGKKKKVFLIFGRNQLAKLAVQDFVHSLGLTATDFDMVSRTLGGSPSVHEVVLKGMNAAQASIVIATPDERAGLATNLSRSETEGTPRLQARANVIYEAGIAAGIDHKRVVIVCFAGTALFSDVDGKLRVDVRDSSATMRRNLKDRIKACGCTVSEDGDWLSAGDFDRALGLAKETIEAHDRKTAPIPSPTPRLTREDDAALALHAWLESHARGHFHYSKIDDELGLPPGLTNKLLRNMSKQRKLPLLKNIEFGTDTFRISQLGDY